MKEIPDGSVDMILADPPYGTDACYWDSTIPLGRMWEQLKRVVKPNGAIVMTTNQPFTTTIIASNLYMFRYCWHWKRGYSTGFANANKMPLKSFEDVCVFYSKRPTYKPQELTPCEKVKTLESPPESLGKAGCVGGYYKKKYANYPTDEIRTRKEKTRHPKGKPVALMEYLIRAYTNEGETVLDFTMGSGTTGVACVNLKRNFIGIELDPKYFKVASSRIQEALS